MRGVRFVPDIPDMPSLRAHHIGFGSLIEKPDGTFGPIRNIAEIVNDDYSLRNIVIPNEVDVEGRKASPIIATQSGLAAIIEVVSARKTGGRPLAVLNAMATHTGGTVEEMMKGGKNTKNFQDWQPFHPDMKPGTPSTLWGSDGRLRSQARFIPTVPMNVNKLRAEDSLHKNEKDRLKQRFDLLGTITPLKRPKKKITKGGKRVPGPDPVREKTFVHSTPLVHYYQSRYIASMLLPFARAAVSLKPEELTRLPKMLDEVINLLHQAIDLSPDVRTEVDALFDMSPVGTSITYRNEAGPAVADNRLIRHGTHIDPGLLHKIYSMMSARRRTTFRKNVAEIIKTLPRDTKHSRRDRDKNRFYTFYSVDPLILEQVLVWIEEVELGHAVQQTNIQTPLISPSAGSAERETAPVGSTVIMPGWMIMLYATDGGSSLLQRIDPELSFAWEDRDSEHDGFEALRMHYQDEDDKLNELMNSERAALTMARESFTGTIQDADEDTVTIFFDELEAGHTAIFHRDELLANEMLPEEEALFRARFNYGGRTIPPMSLKSSRAIVKEHLDDLNDPLPADHDGFGTPYAEYAGFHIRIEEGTQIELASIILDEPSDAALQDDIGLARAFQALGDILMYLVSKNGMAHATAFASNSPFDKATTALLGSYEKPGPASYHAQIHHHLLYEQAFTALEGIGSDNKSGMIALGQTMVFEQYAKNPAKLMTLWMLANYGLIDMGGFNEDGNPEFFTMPKTTMETQLAEKSLMNALAVIIISYYRLAFFPLRLKMKSEGPRNFDLKKNWPRLQIDARNDPPESYAFAAVLRFLSMSDGNLEVEIPAWMPVLPEDFAAVNRERGKTEVLDYIRWSYGSNPTSVEHFCEVAAAYHAAKALSGFTPGKYPEMVRTFLSAVEAERGEGFLMATLIAYNEEDATGEPIISGRLPPAEMPGYVRQVINGGRR